MKHAYRGSEGKCIKCGNPKYDYEIHFSEIDLSHPEPQDLSKGELKQVIIELMELLEEADRVWIPMDSELHSKILNQKMLNKIGDERNKFLSALQDEPMSEATIEARTCLEIINELLPLIRKALQSREWSDEELFNMHTSIWTDVLLTKEQQFERFKQDLEKYKQSKRGKG